MSIFTWRVATDLSFGSFPLAAGVDYDVVFAAQHELEERHLVAMIGNDEEDGLERRRRLGKEGRKAVSNYRQRVWVEERVPKRDHGVRSPTNEIPQHERDSCETTGGVCVKA